MLLLVQGLFSYSTSCASEVRDTVAIRDCSLVNDESDRFLVTKEFRYQVLHISTVVVLCV